ncbi:MAG: 1-acyl-sn-glycerol-3-phosphate acyltransferase, partial [Pseudomonadota bacterium]
QGASMMQTVQMPVWLMLLIVGFALIAALDKVMIPSVRWFFRRRLERAVGRLNERLERPIQPFKLARRHDMIQRLIYDPQVGKAVQAHALENGIPEAVAFEQARGYAREIVPGFSAFAYFSFAIRAARLLSNALYRVRLVGNTAAMRDIPADATVVFVMNHRSNMDYVLVTYLAAEQSALSYAVGEWARVWPLSRLIRAMGAYFIRRKSGSDLYRHVLSCYVRHATEAGVTQAMFPEGGLSLNGKLARPKLGLLSYMINGVDVTERDVVFVPVALNYDRVLEDTVLVAAGQSKTRRFPARIGVITSWLLRQLWRRITGKFTRFGTAAVSIGATLSLRAFHEESDANDPVELARDLMARIGKAVPILPVPLVAYLSRSGDPMDAEGYFQAVQEIRRQKPKLHILPDEQNFRSELDAALKQLVDRRLLKLDGQVYVPSGERSDLLEFYSGSIEHQLTDDAASAKDHSALAGS